MNATRRSGVLLGLTLVASCVFYLPDAWRDLRATKERLQHIRTSSLEQREETTLTWNGSVPYLFETRELVRPVLEGDGVLDVEYAFVVPMGAAKRPAAVRGATILTWLDAPRVWVLGPPLELLESWLQPGRPPAPDMVEIAGCAFIVWAGVSKTERDALLATAQSIYGRPVQIPGRSPHPDLHVTLRFDVAEGLAKNDPSFERFRSLAAP